MAQRSTSLRSCNRRSMPRVLGAALLSVLAAACACTSPAEDLSVSRFEQPILDGEVDLDHPEVMTLVGELGLCTGTVIHVEERTGFLLTAGHCVTEVGPRGGLVPLSAQTLSVVPGADFRESTESYPVGTVHVEPTYDGSFAADVAVARFFFGDAPAPKVTPAMSASEDELVPGDELLLVGFGQTESDEANSVRRRVTRSIDDLDSEVVAYSQEDGKGACFGDSGGPGFVESNGERRVAAVISGGIDSSDDGCTGGLGIAMRVSAYRDFIDEVLARGSLE